jgi:2-polyprenyl-6-methoxyphenol hydroxylase-like FAD-dependent oxidoreductase
MRKVGKDRPYRVAIVGGGIGGLTAAVALHQRGFEVEVYERSSKLEEVGAGLQVGPNGVKVIRALGLWDQFNKIAFQPVNQVSIQWDDASLRHRTPLKAMAEKEYGAPYTTLHRAHLHELLRNALPQRAIHLNANCVGATSTEHNAVARFADGREVEADALIGADGIRSAIRAQLFGADNPRFTEQMCWRCMVPMERVPTRIGPGLSVALAHDEYHGWIGPNGHVICYPIGDGSVLNIFAGHVTDQWVEESWSVPSSTDELLAAYDGWNEALLGMFRCVQHVYKWGIYDRDPIPQWTKGRVTLLGDAAHPTMPTLAQGGNMAIEDGYVLGRNLDRHRDDIHAALKGYVAERQPRTARVTLQSRQQFANNRKVPPPPFLDRTWIFTFDATKQPEPQLA